MERLKPITIENKQLVEGIARGLRQRLERQFEEAIETNAPYWRINDILYRYGKVAFLEDRVRERPVMEKVK